MTCRTESLKRLQELNFVMIDLGLYLNTHPNCSQAKCTFDRAQEKYLDAKKDHEKTYGPLSYDGINTRKDGWSWINEPWPWEVEE